VNLIAEQIALAVVVANNKTFAYQTGQDAMNGGSFDIEPVAEIDHTQAALGRRADRFQNVRCPDDHLCAGIGFRRRFWLPLPHGGFPQIAAGILEQRAREATDAIK
jgi:hypothetical protein